MTGRWYRPCTVSGSWWPNFSACVTAGGPITMPTSTANTNTAPPTIATATVCRQCRRSRTVTTIGNSARPRSTPIAMCVSPVAAGRTSGKTKRAATAAITRASTDVGATVMTKRRGGRLPSVGAAASVVVGLPRSAAATSLLYGSMARETRSLATDVEISGRTVGLVFGLVVLVVLSRGVIVAARRPLGWAVASVVAASFLAPLVERAAQHMRRIFALLLVLLLTAATVGFVFWGVLHDLNVQSERLYKAAPTAARQHRAITALRQGRARFRSRTARHRRGEDAAQAFVEARGQGRESRGHVFRVRDPHDLHPVVGPAHGEGRG